MFDFLLILIFAFAVEIKRKSSNMKFLTKNDHIFQFSIFGEVPSQILKNILPTFLQGMLSFIQNIFKI